jgi:hypothetical protein
MSADVPPRSTVFSQWAASLQLPWVRVLLFVIGCLATAALLPTSIFGAYLLLGSFTSDAPDRFQFLGWSVFGTIGVAGLVAAWIRLLVPRVRFQRNRILRWSVVVALLPAMLIAAFCTVRFASIPMGWISAVVLACATFLLGATLGA